MPSRGGRRRLLPALILLALLAGAEPVSAGFVVAPGAPYTGVGDNSRAIAAGDLDADGDADLAIANSSDPGTVTTFLGDGTGGFTRAAGAPFAMAAPFPSDVDLAELTGDGDLDAITPHNLSSTPGDDGLASLLAGDGAGALASGATPSTGGDRAIAVEAVDATGDGPVDLVVANGSAGADAQPGRVVVLPGNGDGTFLAAVPVGDAPAPTDVVARDVDGDARVDVVTADRAGTLSVFLQLPGGTFSPAPGSPVPAGATELVGLDSADFDGDGDADLAATSREPLMAPPPGRVAILLGDGAGGFAPAAGSPVATGGPSARGIAATDLDGDCRADLAVTHAAIPGSVGVLVGDGTGGFAPLAGSPFPTSFVEQATALAVADFDGDTLPDVATAHAENAARMVVLLNTGPSAGPCGKPKPKPRPKPKHCGRHGRCCRKGWHGRPKHGHRPCPRPRPRPCAGRD